MAKKAKTTTPLTDKNNEGVYFTQLKITDLKCFHGENTINLSAENGDFARWTVILGNNNTGKTTILKALAGFEPIEKRAAMGDEDTEYLDVWIPIAYNKLDNIASNKELKVKAVFYVSTEKETINIEYMPNFAHIYNIDHQSLQIYAYSTSRNIQDTETEEQTGNTDNLLENKDLMNCEKWLKDLYLSEKLGNDNAGAALQKIKTLLTSGILPDVTDFTIKSIPKGNTGVDNFIAFQTDYGVVRFRDLGYGYQSMTAWVLDLVRRMMERYPNAENPLAEPAVVLVDEIDLHLHPEWQRKIVGFLSHHFPKTQFIVTAHSPLIVQSAESVNVVLLKKQGDKTIITQPETQDFSGWSVEEILNDLMGLGERVNSDKYNKLTKAFENALENEDGKAAKAAYDALDAILPHNGANVDRKLMKIQMAGLAI
jgi:hypothetical protein